MTNSVEANYELLHLVHQSTFRQREPSGLLAVQPVPAFAAEPAAALPQASSTIALPATAQPQPPLLAVIQQRHTLGLFDPAANLPLDVFAQVLAESMADTHLAATDMALYVVANRVAGVAPGAYRYSREPHTLVSVAGPFDLDQRRAMIWQSELADAPALVYITADLAASLHHSGNRGYRYAHLAAGIILENLYLSTIALGIGCRPSGSWAVHETDRYLGLTGGQRIVVGLVGIGAEQSVIHAAHA